MIIQITMSCKHMKKSRKAFVNITFIIFIFVIQLKAQQSVHSAGGDSKNTEGSISYSIGQVTYVHTIQKDVEVFQGVQHPNEILIVGLHESDTCIYAIVYPNPIIDKVILQLQEPFLHNTSYLLSDINGRHLQSAIIYDRESVVDMSKYVKSIYFLYVLSEENTVIQVFKIIKN